jgi:hypothetical protein
MGNTLIPDYLNMDFTTIKARIADLLENTTTFADYNYEGSNITLLIELIAYLGALTTYYTNKVAKNQYIDTADLYETVHMLSRLRGYNPQGYRSAQTDLTITITTSASISPGDEIHIQRWKQIDAPDLTDENGDILRFSTIADFTYTIPTSATFPYTLTEKVPIRQGIVRTYSYRGEDLIDNILYLPFENYDYDDDIDETEHPSVEVQVNDEIWTRISDFYDELSGLSTIDTVYMFRFDKYEKYLVEFSTNRNVPNLTDDIVVYLLKSAGLNSAAGGGTITSPETTFMTNRTTGLDVPLTEYTAINELATTGSSGPETIAEIKSASTGAIHSQYRNVTKRDYTTHLEARSDVIAAHVWGEQEIAPSGSIQEYNRVHISLIPDEWGDSTISYSSSGTNDEIIVPSAYSQSWEEEISTYLEPRKILTTYELYELPDLVYFSFDMGIKIKRTYVYTDVMNDVRSKLQYYFESKNRAFNEIISHIDIVNYIMDTAETSTSGETWSQVKGIQNLIVRNVDCDTHSVYEPNISGLYPYYIEEASTYPGENKLRKIQLGHNQFPALLLGNCEFSEET